MKRSMMFHLRIEYVVSAAKKFVMALKVAQAEMNLILPIRMREGVMMPSS